ncbi:serine/threonine protein kinase [Actinocorallia herbida]|uniref:non-specific serine/threonine protein kinase n=1 Tax=Actinocorallia herbida TaxID=58109 RepID=A0A3N1CPY9_9ACTN|nr:serine/threonine-protein kinase [Actinocorallia herbida]ROO83343.1 serine/threonine protein kinase [Actinocorallia herbida]
MDHSPGALVAERYRLTRILGRGGMGVVWQAADERLRRDVALKQLVLPPGLSDQTRDQLVARVEREALAAAMLKHPGIVTVHDRVTDGEGIPWIVMELVRGRSLADAVKADGPLRPREAARIGRAVLAALETAHAHGVVHRDIKPANILLEDERVVLTDFGIAAVEGEGHLTQTGSVLGTPSFMAPEQVAAQPVGPAADLWSLGATLYYAVEGRSPFAAPSPSAVFVAILQQELSPSANAGPLAPVLHALLRKDPAARPTAAETTAMLDRASQVPPAASLPSAEPSVPAFAGPATGPITPLPTVPVPEVPGTAYGAPGPDVEPATTRVPPPPPGSDGGEKRPGKGKAIAVAVAVLAVALGAFVFRPQGSPGTGERETAGTGSTGSSSAAPSPGATLPAVPPAFVGTWEEETDVFSLRVDIEEGSVGAHIAEIQLERGENRCKTLGSLTWASSEKIVIRMDDVCEDDSRMTLTLLGDGQARYVSGTTDVTLGHQD